MPIVMSKDEWAKIVKWTDQDREDPDVVRRREYVKYLDSTSKAMTKYWPNSLENVNKRNEELRRARIDAAEQANTNFYKRYVKRQKEQQQRLMYSARDMVFKNKDAPKLLLSAVIETVIQKERIEQLKFLEAQRRRETEQKRHDDDEIIRKAKEWNELIALKKKRRFEANKQHQKDILDQAHEVAERNRTEYETELNLQKLDNMKANEQMDAIKEFEDNFKAAEKARIRADMQVARAQAAARRRGAAARARAGGRLREVLLRSRARTERRRQQTEVDVKNEKLRVLENISKKLESGDAAREAKEQAILNKAIKEKEDAEEARRQAQSVKQAKFKQERLDTRNQFLRDEEQRLREFNTMRQWEIMNRFKNAEIYEDYQEKLRQKKERQIEEYREDILRQWKERDERSARERADTRHFYGELAESKLRAADNKLLAHAASLLAEAAARARPDLALHKAIHRYCKLYRLYPMPELPASMQEHFRRYAPWDGSRPDAAYREPAPPPPDCGPDTPDREPHAPDRGPHAPDRGPHAPDRGPHAPPSGHRRDGLQSQSKVGASKSNESKKMVESVGDSRRAGRADGLQRRKAQYDVTLPPIAATPCKTEACGCEMKPRNETKHLKNINF